MWKSLESEHGTLFAMLVGLAVVFYWRGVWGLIDLFLFPDNEALSYAVSILLGLVVLRSTRYLRKELI